MLKSMMQMAGEDFEIVRNGSKTLVKGARNTSKTTNRKYVHFYPGTDVKVGDTIIQKVSGAEWLVVEVDYPVFEGKPFSVDAYYQTDFERKSQSGQSINYNFNNSSNIIAGNQTTATMTVNISAIEAEIEEKGGDDKAELMKMVKEIQQIFDSQENASKGALARFSETLEKHSWITSSIIQLLGSAAIQYFIG